MTTVAIQGQEGSFHAIAASQFLGDDVILLACETFAQTFQAVKVGRAGLAVVAIENSLFGSINEVYDLLLKHRFWISGEIYLRVEQCLLGLPGTILDAVQEVYSHPVALGQCEQFLDSTLPQAKRFEHHDTAGAAADIKKWDDPTKTAIASRSAAKIHGLEILAREIETHKQNYTRFVALSTAQVIRPEANKTSLILEVDEKAGALHAALGTFAKRDINLTKLQSRPIIGKAWHYIFYVDVDYGLESSAMQSALTELQDQNCEITILGSYQSGR